MRFYDHESAHPHSGRGTSNVDSRTELRNAFTILVVKDGTIIEQGNHEKLIRLYRNLPQ